VPIAVSDCAGGDRQLDTWPPRHSTKQASKQPAYQPTDQLTDQPTNLPIA